MYQKKTALEEVECSMDAAVTDQNSASKHDTQDVQHDLRPDEKLEHAYTRRELSDEHKAYLVKRHGTLELDPLPSMDPNEPYNWPRWQSNVNLGLLSFHALMIGFMTGSPIPAFGALAEQFNVSLDTASYICSIQIIVLGVAPLFWQPISRRYGRRPVWLISTLLSGAANAGCAFSNTYPQLMVARVFQAFSNAPAGAIGAAVVVELFFARERGLKMGIWTLMVMLGNPLGGVVFGFVSTRLGWRWIFRILAAINLGQFITYFLFSPETRYIRRDDDAGDEKPEITFVGRYLKFGKIPGSDPLKASDFWAPLTILKRPSVSLPALAHTITFSYCSVLTIVMVPALVGVKFDLNYEQIGLNFIPVVIGTLIGELMAGPVSDWWMAYGAKRGIHVHPERRLWLFYPALTICIIGLCVFLITLEQATPGKWNVRPCVGLALAAVGNQMSTTPIFTYACDKNLAHADQVGVAIIMTRQIWGFIGPFWFPVMFSSIGLVGSSALSGAIMLGVAGGAVFLQQFFIGRRNYLN